MSNQTGALVKEARTSAGMTQKELAEAVDGLSARNVSEAERGLRELPDEQLAAIAEVTGSEALALAVAKDEPFETPAEAAVPAGSEEDILKLFDAANPAVKAAALSVLKGDTPQSKGLLNSVLPSIVEMLGSNKDGDPLTAIIGFLATEQGGAFLDSLKGVLGNVTSMFSRGTASGEMEQEGQKAPGSLLVFTFLYAVAIYILLLSFYFWLIRTDIKPEQ